MLHFSYAKLPKEFTTLLKSNPPDSFTDKKVYETIGSNRSLGRILEIAFKEFDDGRRLDRDKWPNFRERVASLYVYRSVYGDYPAKTSLELVEDLKQMESAFADHASHSSSRMYLLGFYLKLSKSELVIPETVRSILKLSQGRSERPDWLVLITWHFLDFLGEKMLTNYMASGKTFDDIYKLMSNEARFKMLENLLKYGASIEENDVFLYEKI